MLSDTSPHIEALLVTMWRTASAPQKIAMVDEARMLVKNAIRADLRRQFPDDDEATLDYRVAARFYGTDFLSKMGVPTPSAIQSIHGN